MSTVREQIFEALYALVVAAASGPGSITARNDPLPNAIPAAGIFVLRDGGKPGDPIDTVLGNPPIFTYEETVEIEVAVQNKDAALRNASLDTLLIALGVQLSAHRTLGALAQWCQDVAPEFTDSSAAGGAPIRSALVPIKITYDVTGTALA